MSNNFKQREEAILYLTDEDLQAIGVDPTTISDELFDIIVEELKEYVNENFQNALFHSYESAKETSEYLSSSLHD